MVPRPRLSVTTRSIAEALEGPRGRRVLVASAGAVVAIGLLGFHSLDRPGARFVPDGARMRIEVVHPVEPEILPGAVMEVGELVDGFQGLPPPAPAPEPDWLPVDFDYEPAPPPPASVRRVAVVEQRVETDPPPPPRRADEPWFGFDAPRRDYRAERALRRARLEAMERARDEEAARRREWSSRRRYEENPARWREIPERPATVPAAEREAGGLISMAGPH